MSKSNGDGLELEGSGAAYIRISDDKQETDRQIKAVHAFEKRNNVTISPQYWFTDEGWKRDEADRRPDFQRLMKLAEAGLVNWIVVDQLDRFGTKSSKQLMHFLYRLEEANCKLFDSSNKEWTAEDDATEITALIKGRESKSETLKLSHRVLGGKAGRARKGEWQGGPVRLGFDVACFSHATGPNREHWRVVFEGDDKRLKVNPDGREERYDGPRNFPPHQKDLEYLRVVPSRDEAKVAAAVSVFERYATESVSFTTLAHYLNGLGFRSSFGGMFQGHHVGQMLADPIYLGYYTWNRSHNGKFHRWTGGRTVPEPNYEGKSSKNDPSDWVQSGRLFEPLVGLKTWNAVKRKLAVRERRAKAPMSPALYLSGLVFCGDCGERMVAGPPRKRDKRHEFICGTYHKHARTKTLKDSPCRRNGVFQDDMERYVGQFLEETSRRLELLTRRPDADHLTERLRGRETVAWEAFRDGITRLTDYLAEHHPDEYAAIVREHNALRHEVEENTRNSSPAKPGELAATLGERGRAAWERAKERDRKGELVATPDDFTAAVLDCFRVNFDPAAIAAEVERLNAEHDQQMDVWARPPTPLSREKAQKRMADLEARIAELKRLREDAAGVVEHHYREMLDLQRAIAEAKLSMTSKAGESALRRRAELLRAVIQRIECKFTATGKTGGGPGRANALLTEVTVYTIAGDSVRYPVGSGDTLQRSSVVSRW